MKLLIQKKVILLLLAASFVTFILHQSFLYTFAIHFVPLKTHGSRTWAKRKFVGIKGSNRTTIVKNVNAGFGYTEEDLQPDRGETDFIGDEHSKIFGCRKLPDVLLIGFEKCGTVPLKLYMGIHPQIFVPSLRGNIHLFDRNSTVSVEEYTKSVSCTPDGKLRLEKICTDGLADKAFAVIPNAKLIALVKEPVERAMSHYIHKVHSGLEKGPVDFDSTIASIMDFGIPKQLNKSVLFRQSMYIDRLQPWISTYGLDKILILDGDNFVRRPTEELQKVERFLEIVPFFSDENFVYNSDKKFYCLKEDGNTKCMTKDKGRPHPQMSNVTRNRLQEYFKPYNEKLFIVLGRNFSWNY